MRERMSKLVLICIMVLVLCVSYSFAVDENVIWPGRSTGKILQRTAVALATGSLTFDTTYVTKGVRVTRYVLECPNMTGNGTTTLSFIDANSKTVWAGAAHPENATYSVPIDVELAGTYTIRLTLSLDCTDPATAYLTLYGDN